MPSQTYDIYFSGQVMDGKDPVEARRQVGSMFKADQEQLDQLFSGTRVRIKSNVDEETATKYRVAFRNAGALIEIQPSDAGAENTGTPGSVNTPHSDTGEGPSLLPANTGSLEEYAPRITPQTLPDIDHLTLAATGSIIDESPEPEPPDIDTDSLSMGAANSGTLEDCKKEPEAYPIPDISHLDLDNS